MTILFIEDWERLGAAPDWSTSNQSALRVATSLKRMGIANHAFMLALYDQDLIGVDPFDPDLPIEYQAKVTIEFGRNLWYALRECIKIPPVAGVDDVPFRFHRANLALAWTFLNNLFNINVIGRQRGKTMAVVSLLTWLLNSRVNLTISSITKDDDLRSQTIKTFKKVYDALPPFLKFRNSGDSKNTFEFTVNALKNIFKMAVPSTSPKRAYMVGRGLTSSTTWSDESCFSPNIRISLGACIASGTFAREEAVAMGEPSGIILTTTAGRLDDPDAAYVYELIENSTPFNESLYDADNKIDLLDIVRNNNAAHLPRTYCIFNHLQLGVTNRQQLEAMQMSAQSKGDAERDFLSIWNRGASFSPLPPETLEIINNSIIDPFYSQLCKPENFLINWYVDMEVIPDLANYPMIVGIDPSEGIGQDAMALCLVSVVTGEVIATATQSILSIPTYIRWLYKTFVVPYTNTLLVIENRSTGQSIIDGLCELMILDNINPFTRIFNTIVQEKETYKEQYRLIRPPYYRPAECRHITYKKFFGFKTNGAGQYARGVLYGEIFHTTCTQRGNLFKDRKLCSEINALFEKDGKIQHPPGGHDDLVIALLLAHWALQRLKNVEAYGLSRHDILPISMSNPNDTPEVAKLNKNREYYGQLLDELHASTNLYYRKTVIHKLRNLELEYPEVLEGLEQTMDQILHDLELRRSTDRVINSVNPQSGGQSLFYDTVVGK